jgi:hypothetical protein
VEKCGQPVREVTGLDLWFPTGHLPHTGHMGYEVSLSDGSTEVVPGADTYQQEGPLTTFFATEPGRRVVDGWSTRLASFRTVEVVRIRRSGLQVAA